jgi:hypothetical protein
MSNPTHEERLRASLHPSSLPWRWSAVVAIATFVLVFCALGAFMNLISKPSWIELHRMAHNGGRAIATVTSVDRANHNSCTFHYTVNAQGYSSTDSCAVPASPGGQIEVTYALEDPSLVTTGNPGDELQSDLIVLFIGAAGFAIGLTYSVRKVFAMFATRSGSLP